MRMLPTLVGPLTLAVFLSAPVLAVDNPIPGKVTVVKAGKLIKFVSKSKPIEPATFPLPAPGSADDPTVSGAELRVFDRFGAGGDVTFNLDNSGWTGLGDPPGSSGYKYKGKDDTSDPDPKGTCRIVLIKEKVIKGVCKGASVTLTTPFGGPEEIILGIPAGSAAFRYCAEFGGEEKRNDSKTMKRQDAPVPGACPVIPWIGSHKCVLDGELSSIHLMGYFALPPFPANGAIDISCASTAPDGKATCDCGLQFLDPIYMIGIGLFCFSPGVPCPSGEIDCDGGNALDATMDSDHNIGACTSNPDCAAQCTVHCAPDQVFDSACEEFCVGGANDTLPCTHDSDCPAGHCPGKDSLPHGNICGCDCLAVGGASSRPGGLQCNLSVNIDIEVDPPCGDGDVLMVLGTRCFPLTTETITSQIHNWSNMPGHDFPLPPTSLIGTPADCVDLGSSITTGLRMVGSVNFFDTGLLDIHTVEDFTCQ